VQHIFIPAHHSTAQHSTDVTTQHFAPHWLSTARLTQDVLHTMVGSGQLPRALLCPIAVATPLAQQYSKQTLAQGSPFIEELPVGSVIVGQLALPVHPPAYVHALVSEKTTVALCTYCQAHTASAACSPPPPTCQIRHSNTSRARIARGLAHAWCGWSLTSVPTQTHRPTRSTSRSADTQWVAASLDCCCC
jgi:hypothetical protein